MLGSRPDIAFIVGYLSRFLEHPTKKRWNERMRVLWYLKGTANYALTYESNDCKEFRFFSDSDYASCIKTRKSVSGSLITTDSGPLVWSCQLQRTLAFAAVATVQHILYFVQLITELGYNQTPVLQIDNAATICLVRESHYRKRTKHIQIRYLFLSELVQDGKLKVEHVPTEAQLADILTKTLHKATFQKLRSLI